MSDGVSNVREALLAELIGESSALLARVERMRDEIKAAEGDCRQAAQSLAGSADAYRSAVDDMVARLRSELGAWLASAAPPASAPHHAAPDGAPVGGTDVTRSSAVGDGVAATLRHSMRRDLIVATAVLIAVALAGAGTVLWWVHVGCG